MFRRIKIRLKKLLSGDHLLTWLVLCAWIAILFAYFFPWQYTFDGNLLVKAMSFTYTGKQEKLFLYNLENIEKLSLKGAQPQTITLNGKFSSTDPALNPKLSKLNKLEIQFPYTTSHFILTATDSLTAQKLRINPNNRIQNLTYQTQPNHQISFCLETVPPIKTCDSQENNRPVLVSPKIQPIGKLKLNLGQQNIKVTLGKFKSPELGNSEELTFDFIPTITELQLQLFSPTQLFIDLRKLSNIPPTENNPLSETIWGDLDVSKVQFFQYKRNPTNVADEQQTSTIIEGKVRMGSQVMELQADQFLIVPAKEPDIQKLSYIRFNSKAPQGLRTSFTGISKSIAAGLYPEFPVQDIKPSLLSKFPQEGINALLSFLAALTGMLLPRLFPESSRNSK